MDNSSSHNRKRARDDSDDSETNHTHSESKLIRVDSTESDASSPKSGSSVVEFENSDVNSGESSTQTPARVDSEDSVMDSVGVKLIQDDLLNILDDSYTAIDREPAIQDLDSVIKSFEEEIQVPAFPASETTSRSGESSQPELGYLQEASDDELGLPPTNGASSEEGKIEPVDFTTGGSDAVGLNGMLGFEHDIMPSYDSFDFGIGGVSDCSYNYNGGADYVALGSFFDYLDGDVSEMPWPAESLSAL